MKTLESKETRAQGNDMGNAQFSLCCNIDLNAGFDFKIDIRHFPFSRVQLWCETLTADYSDKTVGHRPLANPPTIDEQPAADFVKIYKRIMRGIIIKHINVEDMEAIRHLQATEGYLELGMFEEAAEELGVLDPAWFAFKQTVSLQRRVLAGLNQCRNAQPC